MNVSPAQTELVATSDRLHDISTSGIGDLREVPFALLLRAMAEHQRSGVLTVRKGKLTKRIALENGIPVECQSNMVHERLGRYMVGLGKLTEADLARCLSEALPAKIPLGEVLIRHRLVTAFELYRYLQQNLAKKLLDVFSWHEGLYEYSSEMFEVSSPLKVRVHQLILTGVMRFASQDQVDLLVMTMLGQKLALHPAPPVDPMGLRLTGSQRLVLSKLEPAAMDMSTLAEAARLDLGELSRQVYAFITLGFVGPVDELATVERAPVAPVAEAAPAEMGNLPQEELVDLFLAHRRKDAYDLLEVPEEATHRAIEVAYLQFAQKLAPWTYGDDEALIEKASDIFLAGARSFAILSDRTQRENLLTKRRNQKKIAKEEAKPVAPSMKIETDLLDPEVQYHKGKQLAKNSNYKEALQFLEFAADCDPQNGVYRSEVAYCRYVVQSSDAEAALSELAEARRLDRFCGEAWFYAGEILMDLERWSESEEMLKASIRPMLPDRRPIESLKELTKRSKKKRRLGVGKLIP